MNWLDYVVSFFAGAFFANAVPHFVQGISGNRFPTPFAKPPGRGLSSPLVNVLWALFNLAIGGLAFCFAEVLHGGWLMRALFFVGFACMSIFSSVNFAKKHTE